VCDGTLTPAQCTCTLALTAETGPGLSGLTSNYSSRNRTVRQGACTPPTHLLWFTRPKTHLLLPDGVINLSGKEFIDLFLSEVLLRIDLAVQMLQAC
jgi:hypothetical protein